MAPTIVVPLDTSADSEVSLPVAEEFARKVGGSILLTSVIEAPSEFGVWLNANDTIEAWVDHHINVDQYLTRIAESISGIEVQTLVSTGNPSIEINVIAEEQTEPLIVMGSHARAGVTRMTAGSVAASVLHNARCPVIVVRQGGQPLASEPTRSLDRVLVALDGSEFAEQALSAAQAVLGTSGLTLHLLRVVETTKWYGSTFAEVDYAAVDMYIEASYDASKEYLKAQAAELEAAGHTVTWDVRDGMVSDHINEVAHEFHAGLIVMSTHGRTGLSRVLMGSVAERVIHEAERPVMLVNPRAEEE